MRVWVFAVGIVSLSAMVMSVQGRKSVQVSLANRFLESLSADQKGKAQKPFDDDYRTNWRYVPANREGINLGQMTPAQTDMALALLRSSLGEAGWKRTETIKSLEDVLKELENGNAGRDKRLYTFTFFGEPTNTGKWAWRYEGHHVSLNFTFNHGELVSSSPQFFGSNPAEVRSGPLKGTRVLGAEQDLGFALLDSLSPDQLKKATIGDTAPGDVVTSNTRKAGIQKDTGLHFAEMTKPQQETIVKLLHVYNDAQSPFEAKRRWGRVDLNSLVFAWMGSTKPGKGHYYRIQGSKFLVEYDNTQNDANHIHSVWRDFDGDFGQDVLAEHYARFH